ncbi:hypothetical protein I79_005176 [Cricetulus griseus]|uniref:Uncharacterized protein n=1 Tax=Cricetulus griseus TaxID=10029 RepID=G3H4H5_CRIGR|nr:hypothetical protein I79_005176 [Cricetulus griseus]
MRGRGGSHAPGTVPLQTDCYLLDPEDGPGSVAHRTLTLPPVLAPTLTKGPGEEDRSL